jgi:diguanylate cyclase (GGDEF)-like protein
MSVDELHPGVTASIDALRLLDCVDDAILVLAEDFSVRYANRAVAGFAAPGTSSDAVLDPAMLVHPDDLVLALEGFARVVGTGDRHVERMRVREGDGWRPVEATLTDCSADPGVRGVVICFRNLTEEERYRESLHAQIELAHRNRTLHDQLRERQHFLSRLVRIQASISRRAPLAEVLGAIVDGAHQLLGDPVIELHLESDGGALALEASHGVTATSQGGVGNALGALAHRTNRLVHADALSDQHAGAARAAGVAVPIRRAGRPIGSLTVTAERPDRVYSVAECEVLESLADHAGIAIMDAQTVESMNEALTDELTGLPTRRLLVERLQESLDRSGRSGHALALMFIDLDGFKAINDGRGHVAGDAVLVEMARRITASLRPQDVAARLGGDEFVVVIEDTDRANADDVADRMLDAIGDDIGIGDRAYVVSATIGVALVDARTEPAIDADELIRRADIAMYSGKADGRGRVVFFEDWMGRAAEARTELEAELRRAVGDGSLQVAYQPVFRTGDGSVHGVEALARWVSPTQGVVPPAEFIPLAARLGLARRLDRCVLEQACAAMVALGDAGRSLELTVNLSPQHIDAPDLVDGIVEVLARTGMPAHRVLLEITETDALRDPAGAAERLRRLRAKGLRLAIDDFGTGYSTMTYLDQFPIDVVKIDRSFIAGLHRGRRARQLTASIVDLAHSLGLIVVAEGVETPEQALTVRRLGADLVQGYHFQRPGPESSLRGLLDPPQDADVRRGTTTTVPSGSWCTVTLTP